MRWSILHSVLSCVLVGLGDSASIPSDCRRGYRYDVSLRECVPDVDMGEPIYPERRGTAGGPRDPPVPRAGHGTEHHEPPGPDGRPPPTGQRPDPAINRERDPDAARRAADSGGTPPRGRTDDRHWDPEPELCSYDMDEDEWDSWDEDEYDDVMYGGSDWYDDRRDMDDVMYDGMMSHEMIYNRMMDEMYRRYDMYSEMYDKYDGGLYDDWDDWDDIAEDGPCTGTGDWDQWDSETVYDEDMTHRGDKGMRPDGDTIDHDDSMSDEAGDMMCHDDGDRDDGDRDDGEYWTYDEDMTDEDMEEECWTMDDYGDGGDDVSYSTDELDMDGVDPQHDRSCGETPEDAIDEWMMFDDMRQDCGGESTEDHNMGDYTPFVCPPDGGDIMGCDYDSDNGRDEEMPDEQEPDWCDMAPELGTIPYGGSYTGLTRYTRSEFAAPSLYGDGVRDSLMAMNVVLDKAMRLYDMMYEDELRLSHCMGYYAGRRSARNSTSIGDYPDDHGPSTGRPDPTVGPGPGKPDPPVGPEPGTSDPPVGPGPGTSDPPVGPGPGPVSEGPGGPSTPAQLPHITPRPPVPGGIITIPEDAIVTSCTFNDRVSNNPAASDWCRYMNSRHNAVSWNLTHGPMSRERSEGPQSDYNTQYTTRDGYYLYISGSTNNKDAGLLGPRLNGAREAVCLNFWYYIYGESVSLKVDLKYSPRRRDLQPWPSLELRGVTPGWKAARMSLPIEQHYLVFQYNSGDFSFGDNHSGGAIDNIIISRGAC